MIVLGLGLILGLVLGSLVGCLASRATTDKSFWGRSYCESCKKTLAWYDLFPVVSYFVLQGRCRYCKKKISKETLGIELSMGLLVGLVFVFTLPADIFTLAGPNLFLVLADLGFKIFVTCILAIFVLTDLKQGLIPDRISIPAIVISVFYLVATAGYKAVVLYQSLRGSNLGKYLIPPYSDYFQRHALINAQALTNGMLGAVIVAVFFLVLIKVTQERGMGWGDLKFGIFIGLVLGFPNAILALFLAFILGSVVGITLIVFRKKRLNQTIPFGPFLSLGSFIILLWGNQLFDLYLKL